MLNLLMTGGVRVPAVWRFFYALLICIFHTLYFVVWKGKYLSNGVYPRKSVVMADFSQS
nr:MAG TPA: hypothetical protein [Caudoviricetes sp.]